MTPTSPIMAMVHWLYILMFFYNLIDFEDYPVAITLASHVDAMSLLKDLLVNQIILDTSSHVDVYSR